MDRLPGGVSEPRVIEEGPTGQRESCGIWPVRATTGECRGSGPHPDRPGPRPGQTRGGHFRKQHLPGRDTCHLDFMQGNSETKEEKQLERFCCFIML